MAIKLKQGRAVESLSITPLIDVVFLLLIFFLVSTRFEEQERELQIDAPEATESLPLTFEPKQIFVNIDKQGRYFIDGDLQPLDQVDAHLEQAIANNPLTQTVIIRADKAVELQSYVSIVDICERIGIAHSIVTDDN